MLSSLKMGKVGPSPLAKASALATAGKSPNATKIEQTPVPQESGFDAMIATNAANAMTAPIITSRRSRRFIS
jgi:hypothetical protein